MTKKSTKKNVPQRHREHREEPLNRGLKEIRRPPIEPEYIRPAGGDVKKEAAPVDALITQPGLDGRNFPALQEKLRTKLTALHERSEKAVDKVIENVAATAEVYEDLVDTSKEGLVEAKQLRKSLEPKN